MFSSILKIIPRLEASALRNMERTLNGRFARIARSFGRGIINIFRGGGWLGAAMVLIDRILNPLKEVNDSIDRMLQASDAIATNATHFNTTTGRLLKLTSLAKSTGLDENSLFMAMNRYQGAIAEAAADPNRPSAVRQFVGIEDTAEGFFEFIQSLKKMTTNERQLVQMEVFGERQILKMAEFLQLDFAKRYSELGFNDMRTDKLSKATDHLAGLEDYQAVLRTKTGIQDMFNKSGIINKGMIESQDQQERRKLQKTNVDMANYNNLAKVAKASDLIIEQVQKATIGIGTLVIEVAELVGSIKKTRAWRWIGAQTGPKDDGVRRGNNRPGREWEWEE